jgi:hypothetical protein
LPSIPAASPFNATGEGTFNARGEHQRSQLLTVTVALRSCVCSTAGRYRIQLPLWKSRRAISIQNIARQFLARKKVAGIHHEHLEGVKLQKVRGHNI